MGCSPGCVCNCGQVGCGCHKASKSSTGTATAVPERGNAVCPSCKGRAKGQTVRSPLGRVITVIFCGRCDVATPRR